MITKRIFAERVLRKFNGGDFVAGSSKIHKNDVYLEAETCLNYLIQKYINIQGDDINGEFISVFEAVEIKKNTNRNRLYSTLPAQLLALNKGRGMRQISGSKDEKNVYIPTNSGDMGVYNGLEADMLGGKISFWLEGDKVMYGDNMPMDFEGKTVMIKMISSMHSLGEDDTIRIPAEVEVDLEDMVVERLKLQAGLPKDKINDGNPTA